MAASAQCQTWSAPAIENSPAIPLLVFATIGFGLKSGLALGSASFLIIMKWLFDYNTKLPDLEPAINGFRICASLIVGFLFCVCAVLLANYPLSKATTLQMAAELSERRAQADSAEQQALS
jgi:GPH family glycoside/pentoside/hexuronide:cation symporter